jgi:hypothetical protein
MDLKMPFRKMHFKMDLKMHLKTYFFKCFLNAFKNGNFFPKDFRDFIKNISLI